MKDTNRFRFHDASVNVWTAQAEDWASYNTLRKLMRRAGFTFHQNRAIKKQWPSLARTHFAGCRRDVHFVSDIYPAGFKFEFYEDVVRDNRNGGLYHFDKMKKMPYLRRLRVKRTFAAISAALRQLGFRDATRADPHDAFQRMRARRKELEDFQGRDFYRGPVPEYNSKDADGRFLRDGDLRYFRTESGRLLRGTVYRNINNMWWVVLNRSDLRNLASFELFTYNRATHKRKEPPAPLVSMEARLASYVKRQDFERAIGLRDAIQRLA